MQPLVLMGIVLGAAILWVGFVFGMLSILDRAQRKAQRQARKDAKQALAAKNSETGPGLSSPRRGRRRAAAPPANP